ncbi:unnamed protein product [Heligmosomoides polygyrus]|uniref:Ras-GEF domain-containing protein n=1 Tax=Heligmosomoides polygyrus TaxID=6339 RepID=A0A3P8BTB2_HELPZ|nr:unnamed protein product [Heligmosomoides polygyrus]
MITTWPDARKHEAADKQQQWGDRSGTRRRNPSSGLSTVYQLRKVNPAKSSAGWSTIGTMRVGLPRQELICQFKADFSIVLLYNGIHRRLQICNSLYRRGDNVVFPTRVLEVIQNEVNGYDMATTALRTILEVPNKKSVKLANKAVKIFEQDLMLNTVIPAISLFSQSACHPPAGGAIHSSSIGDDSEDQEEVCRNCDIRQYALGDINDEIARLEGEICWVAERAEMVQNRTMATMEVFDLKLAEASKELAESQKMRLAKIERNEKISHEWAEWRPNQLKKYNRTSSEAVDGLRTFMQWSYKALYKEEHSGRR